MRDRSPWSRPKQLFRLNTRCRRAPSSGTVSQAPRPNRGLVCTCIYARIKETRPGFPPVFGDQRRAGQSRCAAPLALQARSGKPLFGASNLRDRFGARLDLIGDRDEEARAFGTAGMSIGSEGPLGSLGGAGHIGFDTGRILARITFYRHGSKGLFAPNQSPAIRCLPIGI